MNYEGVFYLDGGGNPVTIERLREVFNVAEIVEYDDRVEITTNQMWLSLPRATSECTEMEKE